MNHRGIWRCLAVLGFLWAISLPPSVSADPPFLSNVFIRATGIRLNLATNEEVGALRYNAAITSMQYYAPLGPSNTPGWTNVGAGLGFPLTRDVSAAWYAITNIMVAQGSQAVFTAINATNATFTDLTSTIGSFGSFYTALGVFTNVGGTTGRFEHLYGTNATFTLLLADQATIQQLTVSNAVFTNLYVNSTYATNLYGLTAAITTLIAKTAFISSLTVTQGVFSNVYAYSGFLTNLYTPSAYVTNLYVGDTLRTPVLIATNATFSNVVAHSVNATTGVFTDIKAHTAIFTNVYATQGLFKVLAQPSPTPYQFLQATPTGGHTYTYGTRLVTNFTTWYVSFSDPNNQDDLYPGQLVDYLGSVYIVKSPIYETNYTPYTTNSLPATPLATNFALFVQKGTDGSTGPVGPAALDGIGNVQYGIWDSGRAYLYSTSTPIVVSYAGRWYDLLVSNTNKAPNAAGATNFWAISVDKGDNGTFVDQTNLVFRGEFDSGASYVSNDVVYYGGNTFIKWTNQASIGQTPQINSDSIGTNSVYWDVLVSRGLKGVKGQDGTAVVTIVNITNLYNINFDESNKTVYVNTPTTNFSYPRFLYTLGTPPAATNYFEWSAPIKTARFSNVSTTNNLSWTAHSGFLEVSFVTNYVKSVSVHETNVNSASITGQVLYLNIKTNAGGGIVNPISTDLDFTNAGLVSLDRIRFDEATTSVVVNANDSVNSRLLSWNTDRSTLRLGLNTNVFYDFGQQELTYVRCVETGGLAKGEVVYLAGSQGDNVTVRRAANTNEIMSSRVIGITAEAMSLNNMGYIVSAGSAYGFNTSGYSAGTPLYLGASGNFRTNIPPAPNHGVFIGLVERSHPDAGQIFVSIQNYQELEELSDVAIRNPQDGETLIYVAAGGYWTNKLASSGNVSWTNAWSLPLVDGNTNTYLLPLAPTNYVLVSTGTTSIPQFLQFPANTNILIKTGIGTAEVVNLSTALKVLVTDRALSPVPEDSSAVSYKMLADYVSANAVSASNATSVFEIDLSGRLTPKDSVVIADPLFEIDEANFRIVPKAVTP